MKYFLEVDCGTRKITCESFTQLIIEMNKYLFSCPWFDGVENLKQTYEVKTIVSNILNEIEALTPNFLATNGTTCVGDIMRVIAVQS